MTVISVIVGHQWSVVEIGGPLLSVLVAVIVRDFSSSISEHERSDNSLDH